MNDDYTLGDLRRMEQQESAKLSALRARVAELESMVPPVGALVLPPGDTSPLGELVRAAVEFHGSHPDEMVDEFDAALFGAADATAEDPAVRQWAERGRE
jgi:hypothetical protein